MVEKETAARQTLMDLIRFLGEEKNTEKALSLVAEDVYCMPPGEGCLICGKAQLTEHLRLAAAQNPASYAAWLTGLQEKEMAPGLIQFFCQMNMEERQADKEPRCFGGKLTAVFREDEEGWRATALHLCTAPCAQRSREPVSSVKKIQNQGDHELQLYRKEYYTNLLLINSTAGMMALYRDVPYPFAYVGDNLIGFLGYEREDFLASFQNYLQLCHPLERESIKDAVESQLRSNGSYELEYRLRKKDGSYIWVLDKGSLTRDEDGREILINVLLDHSNQKRVRDRLLLQSRTDSLTQVYNRYGACKEINLALAQGEASSTYALLLLDLDNFKQVNDHYGHLEGDNALIKVGKILSSCFRGDDVVARLGGDEFIVFLKNAGHPDQVSLRVQEMCDSLVRSVGVQFERADLTVSVGVAYSYGNATTYEELYKEADNALYQAKYEGKNTHHIVITGRKNLAQEQTIGREQPVL